MARLTEYTDEQKAHALAVLRSNAGNMKKTARETGYPRSTLRAWAGMRQSEGKLPADVPPALVDEHAENLAKRWSKIASLSLEVLEGYLERLKSPEKVTSGAARDLSVVGAVATEKESFARGGPTSRTEAVRVSLIAPNALRNDKLRVIEGGKRTDDASGERSA